MPQVRPGCLLCARPGRVLRRREPAELAASYRTYLGAGLPDAVVGTYFTGPIEEFECQPCGLRWYHPGCLGDGDYYAALGSLFPWYYNHMTWDKQAALDRLRAARPSLVVELGCGNGFFLGRLKDQGIDGIGIDINRSAVEAAKANGLRAYLPGERPVDRCDVLCLFQTIEHVDNPVGFLKQYIQDYKPREVLLSAPSSDGILGYTSDPLVWPPHHRSLWSAKGFRSLARMVGLTVTEVAHQQLTFEEFARLQRIEPTGRFVRLPRFPEGRTGRLAFRVMSRLGFGWARLAHSILVRMA